MLIRNVTSQQLLSLLLCCGLRWSDKQSGIYYNWPSRSPASHPGPASCLIIKSLRIDWKIWLLNYYVYRGSFGGFATIWESEARPRTAEQHRNQWKGCSDTRSWRPKQIKCWYFESLRQAKLAVVLWLISIFMLFCFSHEPAAFSLLRNLLTLNAGGPARLFDIVTEW